MHGTFKNNIWLNKKNSTQKKKIATLKNDIATQKCKFEKKFKIQNNQIEGLKKADQKNKKYTWSTNWVL